jgi:hypothetical protein
VSPGDTTNSDVSPSVSPSPSASPSTTPTPSPTVTPSATPKVSSQPTATPKVTQEPDEEDEDSTQSETKKKTSAKKGTIFSHYNSNGKYRITNTNGSRTVTYLYPLSKGDKTVKIPATVTYKGKKYKVTAVADKALYGNKKLVYLTLGKNIRKIGKSAFANCTSLRYIMVKTGSSPIEKVGKNAFSGTSSLIRVKTTRERWRIYDISFRRAGLSERALFIVKPVPLVLK